MKVDDIIKNESLSKEEYSQAVPQVKNPIQIKNEFNSDLSKTATTWNATTERNKMETKYPASEINAFHAQKLISSDTTRNNYIPEQLQSKCPSDAEIETNIREFVTPESLPNFTRKLVRERVEVNFGLPPNFLLPYKSKINEILTRVIDYCETSASQPSNSHETSREELSCNNINGSSSNVENNNKRIFISETQPSQKSQRVSVTLGTRGGSSVSNAKRSSLSEAAKNVSHESDNKRASTICSETTSSSSSEASADESSGESSDPDHFAPPPSRKAQPKPKTGIKKAQARLMTKAAFSDAATPLELKVGDMDFKLNPRVFGTGSCGWYFGSKVPLMIGDKEALCLLNVNCTVVGSKLWTEGKKKKHSAKS